MMEHKNLLQFPQKTGLYDPSYEKDSCGVGMVANIKGIPSRQIMEDAYLVNSRMDHRGGCGFEENTGDGAGILIALPHNFFKKISKEIGIKLPKKGSYSVGNIFLPQDEKERELCKTEIEKIVGSENQAFLGWRTVPTDSEKANVGPAAKLSQPVIEQLFIKSTDGIDHDLFFERARHELDGVWTVEGNRTILLHRDLLLRFEMLTIPYLANIPRSSDPRFEWKGIDDVETLVYWDGAAESARKQFLASGDLALIASPEHWIGISHQYLAKQGLGLITDVESIDDYGGIRIKMSSVFHPALVVGRLIGCWERAEGRAARAEWTSESEGCEIILCSRREISTE